MMKNLLLVALSVAALLAFACSRDEQSERSSASYEVISEGAASGVTSTIGDAGEPLTSTNVDTTTAFTFVPPQPGATTDPTGTSLASELPAPDGSLSRLPSTGVPGSVARPTSPQPSGSISITPSRPVPARPAPAPPVTAPPRTTTTEPEEPEPADDAPAEQPEEEDEREESDPTTTAPTTSPGDGFVSFLLS